MRCCCITSTFVYELGVKYDGDYDGDSYFVCFALVWLRWRQIRPCPGYLGNYEYHPRCRYWYRIYLYSCVSCLGYKYHYSGNMQCCSRCNCRLIMFHHPHHHQSLVHATFVNFLPTGQFVLPDFPLINPQSVYSVEQNYYCMLQITAAQYICERGQFENFTNILLCKHLTTDSSTS